MRYRTIMHQVLSVRLWKKKKKKKKKKKICRQFYHGIIDIGNEGGHVRISDLLISGNYIAINL
jgi:hypothetical protein